MSVDQLIEEVQEIAAHPRYKEIRENTDGFKLIVGLGRTVLRHFSDFTFQDFFGNPKVCIESQLQWKRLWHEEIQDDTLIVPAVGVEYAVALEPSLFGSHWSITETTDPWYGEPVIQEKSDLEKLKIPDFYKSGLMPKVHQMYNQMGELVKGKIPIYFPGWARGPWSMACMLRGFTPLYLDIMDDPDFVHRLMEFIVESRIQWETDRCKFLGISPQDLNYKWKYCVYRDPSNSDLYNDEVDGNLFSLKTYREFILPYERKLTEFYGGVNYYHSCGNLTPFLEDILNLPGLNMFHVSPHTDLEKVYRLRKPQTTLQVSLNPVNDLLHASSLEMKEKIQEILTKTQGQNTQIWADALYEGSNDTLAKVKTWVKTARGVYQEFIR